MISCVAIVLIPFYKGSASREKHSWLFRRHYLSDGSSIPYIVPNRSMIISLCEFVSNGMYLTLAVISHMYFSGNHDRMEELMSVWYGVAVLPSYLGISLAAWSLVYACLCDVQGSDRGRVARILTPTVYNLAWIFWSLFIILITLYLASAAGEVEVSTFELAYPLSVMLQRAVNLWNQGQTLSTSSTADLLARTDVVLAKVELLSSKFGEWGCVWIVSGIFLAIFYVFTACYLLRIVKRLLSSRGVTNLSLPGASMAQIELEQEFKFLSRSCLIISITLGLDIAAAFFTTLYSSHLERPIWVTAEALVCHIPGLFMSPVLLFQSWRILTGNNVAEDSEFHEATQTPQTRYVIDLPSHLLGWNTALEWSKYEPTKETENFSGLCQKDSVEEFSNIESEKRPASQMSMSSQMFITQSVTTIHHDKDDRDDDRKHLAARPRRYA